MACKVPWPWYLLLATTNEGLGKNNSQFRRKRDAVTVIPFGHKRLSKSSSKCCKGGTYTAFDSDSQTTISIDRSRHFGSKERDNWVKADDGQYSMISYFSQNVVENVLSGIAKSNTWIRG